MITMAVEMMAFGEIRCRRNGKMKTAPISEPMPTQVKIKPSCAAEEFISFHAITGTRAGMTEITTENKTFRKRITFIRSELRA